ncbi:hypothetical protein BDR03DRAFT_432541 [Suillus americanus]|nr:hypothetical protein BDR03DRAFT_432541 [Suillus americanus]
MTKILRQTRVSPPHLHKRDKIDVPNAVVGILSCQTFVRSRSDPVALSPSTQIAPAHGEEQMFVLARQDSAGMFRFTLIISEADATPHATVFDARPLL